MKKVYFIGRSNDPCRGQHIIKELLDRNREFDICYVGRPLYKGRVNRLVGRIIDLLYSIYRIYNSDIVYLLSENNSNREILIANFFKKRIITEFYISFYDMLVNDWKEIKANSYKAKKIKKMERDIMELSTDLVFLTQREADYYMKVVEPRKTGKIHIVPLCSYERKTAKSNFFYGNKKIPIIAWWGSVIPLHGLDKILEMCKILAERNFQYKMYLFANVYERGQWIKDFIIQNKLENHVILDCEATFKNGKLEEFLFEYCDLSIGWFGSSEKAKTVLTNKVIDACSMNLPILTMRTAIMEDYFNNVKGVYLVNNEPIEMAESLIQIISQKDVVETKDVFLDFFTIDKYINRIINILKEEEDNDKI